MNTLFTTTRYQRVIAALCLLAIPSAAFAARKQEATAAASGDTQTTAFVHASVVPMNINSLLVDQTVVVRGDRIVSVGSTGKVKVPADARVIDATGQYLIPGFTSSESPAANKLPSYLAPDSAVQQQLHSYVAAGHTPFQALQTVTVAPARAQHKDCGTITQGRRADMILLTANPLVDIANVQRVNGVMLGGRWLSPADLQLMHVSEITRPQHELRVIYVNGDGAMKHAASHI